MAGFTRYNSFLVGQFDGTEVIDFNTDVIKVALATATYTPDVTTHDYFNDITNEVTGDGYTAGGETIGSITVTSSAGGVLTIDGSDVSWLQGATGFTNARYMILYKDTGVASTSPLIGYHDFTLDRQNDDNDLLIVWNANGILRFGDGTIS